MKNCAVCLKRLEDKAGSVASLDSGATLSQGREKGARLPWGETLSLVLTGRKIPVSAKMR